MLQKDPSPTLLTATNCDRRMDLTYMALTAVQKLLKPLAKWSPPGGYDGYHQVPWSRHMLRACFQEGLDDYLYIFLLMRKDSTTVAQYVN